jgi:uncharacterized membrane protein
VTTTGRRLLQTFVTGLLTALPLAVTVVVFVWAFRTVYGVIGPNSFFGSGVRALGFGVAGSEVVAYLVGVGVILAAIFALGVVVQTRLRGVLARVVNNIIQRVPLVRNVYDLIRRFVDLLSKREDDGIRSMSPVWLHFGGAGGAAALGLLSSPEPIDVGGKAYLAVLIPTAPVPVGGGLIYVPAEWVTPADVGVEGVTSIYVSMGVTSRQHLPAAAGAPMTMTASAGAATTADTGSNARPAVAAPPGADLSAEPRTQGVAKQ